MRSVIPVTLALQLLCGTPLPAQVQPAAELLRIRLMDFARTRADERVELIAVGRQLLASGGVPSEWVDCSAPSAGAADPTCDQPLGAAEVVLRLLPGEFQAQRAALGVSVVTARRGVYVSAYPWKARLLAWGASLSVGRLLAYVTIHEVGHLLLEDSRHTARGIMRGSWTAPYLKTVQEEDMALTADQGESMMRSIRERLHADQSGEQAPQTTDGNE